MEDVLAFHAEPVEDYVRRRHAELKTHGVRNPEIFARLAEELAQRVVAAPGSATTAAPDRLRIEEQDMCGIVGYVGAQQAAPLLLEGLAGWSTEATTRPVSPCSARARGARYGWRRRPAGCVT